MANIHEGVYEGNDPAVTWMYNTQGEKEKLMRDAFNLRRPTFIPVQNDQKNRIESLMKNVNDIFEPVLKQGSSEQVYTEIQNKIYTKFNHWFKDHKECSYQSRNVRDVRYCSDVLIDRLEGEGLEYAKRLAKEY